MRVLRSVSVLFEPCELNLILESAAEMLVNTDVTLKELAALLTFNETFMEFLEKIKECC